MTRFAMLTVVALGLAGCDDVINALQQGAEAAADAPPKGSAQGPMSEDDKLGQKLNGYIDCINLTSKRVLKAGDRYYSWADREKGVTGEERHVYGLYAVDEQKKCIDGIATSNDAEPDDPELEKAATDYAAAFAEVQPVIAEAHTYYKDKKYKDDGFAKGKELHPKLGTALDAFAKADQALRAEVRKRNETLQQRELERIEQEQGRKLMFHSKNVMAQAKKVIDALYADPKLDLAKFEPVFKGFSKAYTDCRVYSKGHQAETKSVMMYGSFLDDAKAFEAATKALIEAERGGKGPSPQKVSDAYNELVEQSNRLSWQRYTPGA